MPCRAQRHYQADSTAFVNAEWQTDTLDGFLFHHYHFQQRQLFNSNQYLCVIEIPKGSPTHLRFVAVDRSPRVLPTHRWQRAGQ